MFENWQDKLGNLFGFVGGATQQAATGLTTIAGGAVSNVVSPLLGKSVTTTTTAPPPQDNNNTKTILIVVMVGLVLVTVAVFAMKSSKSNS